MASSRSALRAVDVCKTFGDVVALDHVSLDVPEGACVALVGESGSGKSTLLRCFNRLVSLDAGTIHVGDVDAMAVDPIVLRRGIGYVPQDGGLLPHWTVLRNVELVPRLNARSNVTDRARAALDLVGLNALEYGPRWPRDLSGGQRQRVAMARALADEPKVLLLDEPFGALDAITRSDLQEMFAVVRARLGTTSVLVTHDLHEATLLATSIVVLHGGRVEQVAPPATLVAEPATAYVRTLLERARVTEAV